MPKKGITGHDEWVVTEALATALVALEQLPEKHQPHAHMDDLKKLLAAGCQPGGVALHLAQAKCRLFPEMDSLAIYREYGLHLAQAKCRLNPHADRAVIYREYGFEDR